MRRRHACASTPRKYKRGEQRRGRGEGAGGGRDDVVDVVVGSGGSAMSTRQVGCGDAATDVQGGQDGKLGGRRATLLVCVCEGEDEAL